MTITCFSNYLTHHQIPFCDVLRATDGVTFYFVSTMPMEEDRASGGWKLDKEYTYEIKAYQSEENKEKAFTLAKESDVVIVGYAPEEYVRYRMKYAEKKLTFRYSERFYKNGRWRAISPRGFFLRIQTYFRYLGKPLYLLCASAYLAGDSAMLGSYLGRCYRWGYFPEIKEYEDIRDLMEKKKKNSILWAGRMIDWKHPEVALQLAERLRDEKCEFHLTMLGDGSLFEELKEQIQKNNLEEYVTVTGAVPATQVRTYMEESEVFLFTSDQTEGWGAVLNESMNSGCAVVANMAIGSVPYLLKDKENGFVYRRFDELYESVKYLLHHDEERKQVGIAAYDSLKKEWNPTIAAERFVTLSGKLLKKEKIFFESGPCSKAPIFVKRK